MKIKIKNYEVSLYSPFSKWFFMITFWKRGKGRLFGIYSPYLIYSRVMYRIKY